VPEGATAPGTSRHWVTRAYHWSWAAPRRRMRHEPQRGKEEVPGEAHWRARRRCARGDMRRPADQQERCRALPVGQYRPHWDASVPTAGAPVALRCWFE